MSGTGKLTFAGYNINNPPYHAALSDETKYWFLDGFQSQQFLVDPQRLISTKSTLKDWVISTVIRVEAPDKTRKTMLTSVAALARLFDPRRGEQRLTFDEFPDSFFIAKLQKSTVTNENQAPHMLDLAIEFACTGPAYSNIETVETVNPLISSPQSFTVASMGDSLVYPRWRYTASQGSYSGNITIQNATTGESVNWWGNLAMYDTVDFVMDGEYGVPYTALKNGSPNITNVNGPAWPHIVPGENQIIVTGPGKGDFEARFRDRWLVGQQSFGTATEIHISIDTANPPPNSRPTFTVYLTDTNGVPLSLPVSVYYYDGATRGALFNGNTNEHGQIAYTVLISTPGARTLYAEFTGNEYYAPSVSDGLTVNTQGSTIVGLAISTTTPKAKTWLPVWGTLQWYDPATAGYKRDNIVANKPINIWYSSPWSSHRVVTTVMTDATGSFGTGWTLGAYDAAAFPFILHADWVGNWALKPASAGTITIHPVR